MEDKIYECECGGREFWLHKKGTVECVDCEIPINDIEVRFPPDIPESGGEPLKDTGFGL